MKNIVILLLMLVFAASTFAVRFPAGITYLKEGVPTVPDSARLDVVFFPSGTDTIIPLAPNTAVWDTTLNITGINDLFAVLKYTIFSGTDTAYGRDGIRLEYDSSSFQSSFWREIADAADSGGIANVGLYVWTYGTRELTSISDVTLTAAERQAVADSARAEIERSSGFLWNLLYFWGACDQCYTVYFPDDGTSPKDSAVVYNSAGVAQMTIKYSHSNVNTVADTSKVFDR